MSKISSAFLVVLVLAAPLAFSQTKSGMDNPFSVCRDPVARIPMSQLQAAFAGPLYSPWQYNSAKKRFEEAYTQAVRQGAMASGAPGTPVQYLAALNYETVRSAAFTAARLMVFIHDKGALKGSWLNLELSDVPSRAAILVCNRCGSQMREKLIDELEPYVEYLSKNVLRYSISRVTKGLTTQVEGLNSIIQAMYDGHNTDFTNYFNHVAAIHDSDYSTLLETKTIQQQIGRWFRNVDFVCDKDKAPCPRLQHRVPIPQWAVHQAATEFYEEMRLQSEAIGSSAIGRDTDTKIAWYYLNAPGIVSRVVRANPQFFALQCFYLSQSLELAGRADVRTAFGQSALTLTPMVVFFSIGLTTAFASGVVAPVTFTAVTIIGLAEIGWRMSQLSALESVANKLRFFTLIGGSDPIGVLRAGEYQFLIEQDRHNLGMVVLYQGLSLVGGGLLVQLSAAPQVPTMVLGLKDVLDTWVFNDAMFDPAGGDLHKRGRLRN